jgi:hypothetical protein
MVIIASLVKKHFSEKWSAWGNQSEDYSPTWATYKNNSAKDKGLRLFA